MALASPFCMLPSFPGAGWCMSKFFLIPPHLGAARPGVKDGILKYPPLRCCWCCCRGFPCPERESSAAAAPTDRPTDRIALRSLHIHIPLVVTAPPSPSFHFSRNLPDVCDGHNVRQRDHDCHGAQLLLPRPYARIGAAVGADVSFPSPSPHSCVFVDFYSHSATQITKFLILKVLYILFFMVLYPAQ